MRLPLGFQAATGGAGFQVAVADCAGHRLPSLSNTRPIYVVGRCWTAMDQKVRKVKWIGRYLKQRWTALDTVAAGAERQDQGARPHQPQARGRGARDSDRGG